MIPIIGSTGGQHPSRRTYVADEEVPESGIYQIVHEDGGKDTVVFLRGSFFPECGDCGKKVRYLILRAAPYIFDDEDFK